MQKEHEAANKAAKIFLVFLDLIAVFLVLGMASAQAYILPIEPPTLQAKTIHTLTADERSEILIYDIWKPLDLDRVQIGKGAALGLAKDGPIEPYGWQAFVSQDAIGSWRGGAEAMAYGGL